MWRYEIVTYLHRRGGLLSFLRNGSNSSWSIKLDRSLDVQSARK
jgi:hypothetical protein